MTLKFTTSISTNFMMDIAMNSKYIVESLY